MGWVVTSWRSEALAALADAEARAAARDVVVAAEREARRLNRGAARELEALERLGVQTRAAVRRRRGELRATPPAAAPARAAKPNGRATLRDSPLAELFRATAAGRGPSAG